MPSLPTITVQRSDRRTISVQIQPDATLLVKVPKRMADRQIQSFINEHEDWITDKLAKIKQHSSKRQDNEYFYLGQTFTLQPGNYTKIEVKGNTLLFPQSLLFRKEKELTSWYLAEAKRVITAQVEKYAVEMKTDYTEITFSDTRSQWGRCTHDNRLQFSWRLIMAPLLTLNYVVIHELAHTLQKNHTQLFWMKVRNYTPSYRQQIKWLKEYGSTLRI